MSIVKWQADSSNGVLSVRLLKTAAATPMAVIVTVADRMR